MTKKEIISEIASNGKLSKTLVEKVVNSLLSNIAENLKKGNEVNLNGFGKFSVSERAAREGINPLTKEKIQIAAKKSVKFKGQGEMKNLD